MTKYELSLTKDYVPDWTIVDAVRELFQNALDQETVEPTNKMFWAYKDGVLSIGNKMSILEPKSLLLGSTSKASDPSTIGKFGEGYKVATLVLTRLGKKVTFYNYGAKEVWTARFSKTRKYDAEILVFEIDKKFPWSKVPDNNLTITIEGVSEEELEHIKSHNLHMADTYPEHIHSKYYGNIILGEEFKGKMFVNGLFISEEGKFEYGYDLNPKVIDLDRDRRMLRNFDLQWTTSRVWVENKDTETVKRAADLVRKGSYDVAYIKESNFSRSLVPISDMAAKDFVSEYGDKAVPVVTQTESDSVPNGYKPVIVSDTLAKVIKESTVYKEPERIVEPTFAEQVEGWLEKYGRNIKREARRELQQLIEKEKSRGVVEDKLPF